MTTRRRALVITLLALIAAIPATLLVSEAALRAAVAYAVRSVPGLEVDAPRGRLLTGVRADSVRWARDGVVVTITQPAARWQLWPALTGRLHLETFDAAAVDVALAGPDPATRAARTAPRVLPDIELPIVLRVGALAVERVTVTRGASTLVDARAVRAEGVFAGPREFRVERLAAHGAPLTASGSATVQPHGDWPLTVAANGAVELDDGRTLTAGIELQGALAGELAATLRVAGDGIAVFSGTIADVIAAPRVTGELALDDVALGPWLATLDGARFSGAVHVDGAVENLVATVTGTLRTPAWPATAVDAEVNWGRRLLGVRRVRLTAEGIDGVLEASGHVDWTGAAPAGAARAQWQALHWPPASAGPWRSADGTAAIAFGDARGTFELEAQLGDAPAGRVAARGGFEWPGDGAPAVDALVDWRGLELFSVASEHGRAALTGSLDAWTADAVAGVTPPHVEPLLVTTRLVGDRAHFTADALRAEGLGGAATGTATVSWTDGARVDGRVFVKGFDTARLPPRWPGRIDGLVDVEVARTRWSVVLGDGAGQVRERPVSVSGAIAGDGGTIERFALDLDIDGARARAEGRWSPTVDIEWRVDAADVAALVPQARGNLRGGGHVRGDPAAPALSFDVDGADLVYRDYGARRVRGRGSVDLGAGDGAADARLLVEALEAGGRVYDRTIVAVSGTRDDLTVTLDADALGTNAAVRIAGAWRDRAFTGRVAEATLTPPGEDPWRLEAPAALEAAADRVVLAPLCWQQAGTSNALCGDLDWRVDHTLVAHANLTGLPLQDLSRWLPAGFRYTGRVDGTAGVDWRAGREPEISGELEVSAGQWHQFVRGEPVALLNWDSARVSGRIARGTLSATAGFSLVEGGHLDARLELPVFDTADGPADARALDARVAGQFSNLELLPAFIPDIGDVSGLVRADLVVTGTLADPRFDGTVAIEDGVTTIPRLGLNLTNLGLALHGARSALALRGSAKSGGGTLGFDGRFTVTDGRLTGNARLTGDAFRAVNMPEFQVDVSPDITIDVDGHAIDVNGEVRVPTARIAPRDFEGQVTVSADEVLVDEPIERVEEPWLISSRVRIVLGDVRFDGFGLTADVTGNLTAIDEPGRPTRGTGELSVVEGRYEAWGQQLEIAHGRLLFAGGPLTHPGLSVRAVREFEDATVGVDVRGTLREPELQLFSDPPMAQAELLSWLVLGAPLHQTTGAEQQLLDSTRSTAGLAGGEMVARELGRRLGLSDVGIDRGTTPDEAALVIGHYLSPRLYIGYGIGLFDPGNSIRLRYHLHRNWTIEAETGPRADSTDLLWTIER